MDRRVISGNAFGSNTIIVQGNLTSPEPLPTVNNAAHGDGPHKERRIEILRRLYKSPYEDRKDRNPDRARGTCEWFVAHKLFQEWQESKESTTLWVSADPGCGKSVLAKHLINSVLPSTATRTTCYFFFKDDFEDQRHVVSALCCILHQIFKQKRVLLSEAVLEQFEIFGEEITSSFGKLWSALLSVAEDRNAGEIVCLLDAIDECEGHGRSQLAQALQTLYNTGRGFNLKFLLTSRPYVSIRHGFRPSDIPELAVIHLSGESDVEIKKISQEIDTFIHAKVRFVGEKLKLRDDEQACLLQELMRVPNRTYLWVHLTLNLIEQDLDLDKSGIVRITSQLPNTVEEAYERILSRSRNFEEAKKLLHIVVAAARPLTLSEMNLALTLRNHHRSYSDLDLRSEERFRENVRDLCGLFVAVINSRIYLLHQTAKEFLIQHNPANFSKRNHVNLRWKHSLWPQESHHILAEICIWHLLFAEFRARSPNRKEMISQYNDNHVFLDYSAKHWTTHARESHIGVKSPLSQSILQLCDGVSNRCLTWLRIYWRSTNTDFPQKFTALMIASYFGLTTMMKLLLRSDCTDLNSRDGTYKRSALSWAAGNGHHIVVKLLIEGTRSRWKGIKLPFKVGAQVDLADRHDLTPLSYAVLNGHVTAAKVLLKAGARVNTRDSIGGTPLSYAVCNGHEYMVNLLFKEGTNADSEDDISVVLFFSAAEKGHEGIVKLLLDRGRVDPNSKDKDGNTPLTLAVQNGHKPIIELLLENLGDKVTITEEVIYAAAGNSGNGKDVMALLLNRQGQITITQEAVSTIAARFDEKVMTLLSNWQGQITITEEAVSTIAAKFDEKVMTLLLNRQGQITITEKAMSTIAARSNEKVVTLLLNRQDQIIITEKAMSTIAARFDEKVMTLLLNRQDQIPITEEIIKAAVGNRRGKELMALLLDRRGDQITITEDIVKKAIGNSRNGKEVMALLLDRRGDQITITEDIVKKAIGNTRNGKEVMALLLDRRGGQITITEEIIKAAVGNRNGKEVMALLLDRRGDQITITEEIIKAAVGNRNGKEVMALLLDRRGNQITITEEIVRVAARAWRGREVIAFLLKRRRDQSIITEKAVHTIFKDFNEEWVATLLNRLGDQITITEEIVKAAAGNWWNGKDVMALLLDRRGGQITITEEIVKAAAGNQWNGKEVMALLLDRQGGQITITEEIIITAVRNQSSGKEIVTLLLDRRGDQITITEEIVIAAVGNQLSGKEVVTLLLDRRGDQIIITEEILKAAAGNGKAVMELLLDRQKTRLFLQRKLLGLQ